MSTMLVMIRAAPATGLRAREALDAALLFSAFAQIAVLFSGDGVWQLLHGQQPATIGAPSVAPVIAAFAEYEIERVYADARALVDRGIDPSQLLPGVSVLDDDGIRALLRETGQQVLSF